jgi:hypothetical protein
MAPCRKFDRSLITLVGVPTLLASSIPTYEPPTRRPETVLDRILRLDSWARGGLSEAEFNRLFAKCRCGMITTRRVFRNHVCALAAARNAAVIVNLTSDSDDSESEGSVIDLTSGSNSDESEQ